MLKNFILKTDSYKLTHHLQYPEGTEYVYSYFEARNGAEFPFTEWIGLQIILTEFLEGVVVTQADIEQAAGVAAIHFGDESIFNREGWEHIVNVHGGRLPLEIKAVPEGYCVPINNVLMTVVNTDPKCFWLTNAVESILTHVWYPSTVATKSKHLHNLLTMVGKQCNFDFIDFHVHDFGYRGATSDYSAAVGGMAHLVNFKGTDTLVAIAAACEYYSADIKTVGFSVPASEHSVATAEGKDGEEAYFLRMIRNNPNGIVSIVADSYDIVRFVRFFEKHKDEIIERWRNGKAPINRVVIRPDSKRFKEDTPSAQVLWLHRELYRIFGGENKNGFIELHPAVGVIYGDGLSTFEIEDIYFVLIEAGFSISNGIVGQGGGLLQKVNRDTQRFAFKCSARYANGTWHNVVKDPLDVSKKSKEGLLKLVTHHNDDGTIKKVETINHKHPLYYDMPDILQTVFKNGYIVQKYTFEELRQNALSKTLYPIK